MNGIISEIMPCDNGNDRSLIFLICGKINPPTCTDLFVTMLFVADWDRISSMLSMCETAIKEGK